MEKLLNPYDKEYMKMAMLKHEETFKQQVYELHRLYRIQTLLMKNMAAATSTKQSQELMYNSSNNHKGVNSRSLNGIKLEQQQVNEYISDMNRNVQEIEMIDESKLELTLAPSSIYSSRKIKKSETPLNSDSGRSFSSSSTGSSQMKRTIADNIRIEKLRQLQVPDEVTPEYLSGSNHNNSTKIEGQFKQQEKLKHPPWLLQVLNLNTT
ncbi:hypothetical protein ACFE04_023256 [Oxalis oulophora]